MAPAPFTSIDREPGGVGNRSGWSPRRSISRFWGIRFHGRERLAALAAAPSLAGGVSMLGHLSRDHIERRLASAWVQVVPSRWAESFGLVAAEAMMRGTAVIASQVGGLGEFVRNGATGLLVQPGDDRALASALVTVLRDRSLAEEMGRRGREAALAELSDEVCLDRFVALYHEML